MKYLGIEVTHPVVYSLNQGTGTGFTSREHIKKISKSLKPIKNMSTRNRQIFVYKTSVLEFLGGVKTELKKLETICWHYSDLVVSKNVKLKVTSSKLTKSVAEFKEFKRRFKFKPRFKNGWFHLKLYQMFQDLSRRLI